MTIPAVLDAAGRRRSPATMPGYHAGRPPRNKGQLYPTDPPTVEEIVAVMREANDDRHGWRLRALIVVLWRGWRLRALIVVLWRGGLRVQAALALGQRDLDARRGSLLVRNGKGGRRREIGMDAWGFEQLRPWLAARLELPVGPLFCVIDGPTRGRPWSGANVRLEFRRLAAQAGIRRRFAPPQLRHAHAVARRRERDGDRAHDRLLLRAQARRARARKAAVTRRLARARRGRLAGWAPELHARRRRHGRRASGEDAGDRDHRVSLSVGAGRPPVAREGEGPRALRRCCLSGHESAS
jgi:integrase